MMIRTYRLSRRHPPEGTCRSRLFTTAPCGMRLLLHLSPVLLEVQQDPRRDEKSADEDAKCVDALLRLRDLGEEIDQ